MELHTDEIKMKAIHDYLRCGGHPVMLSDRAKRTVVRSVQLGLYEIDEKTQMLMYNTHVVNGIKQPNNRCLIVVASNEERLQLIRKCHTSIASHYGVNNTRAIMSQTHHWYGMKRDIKSYIAACDQCQPRPVRKVKPKPPIPDPQPIKVQEPWHIVGMNVIGPLKKTRNGFTYVLAVTDYFTKFVDFVPLKSKCSLDVANGLQTFFMRWGLPKRVVSNQERKFINAVNDKLAAVFSVEQMVPLAYHPQTNGLDERTNKTLRSRLAKQIKVNQDDWDMYLDKVAFSMRTAPQGNSSKSPFFRMFGRKPVLPHQLALDNLDPEDEANLAVESVDVDECIEPTDGDISDGDSLSNDASESVVNDVNDRVNKGVIVRVNNGVNDRVNNNNNNNVDHLYCAQSRKITAPGNNDVIVSVNSDANDRVSKDVIVSVNKDANDRVSNGVNDRVSKDVIVSVNINVNDRVNKDVYDRVSNDVNDRVSKDVIVTVNNGVNDRVSRDVIVRVNKDVNDRVSNDVLENIEKPQVKQSDDDRKRRWFEIDGDVPHFKVDNKVMRSLLRNNSNNKRIGYWKKEENWVGPMRIAGNSGPKTVLLVSERNDKELKK